MEEWDDLDTLGSEEERLLQSVTEEQEVYFDGNMKLTFAA